MNERIQSQAYFSIITVCWNEGEGILRTCESIAEQTFDDFEWLVVDGGSTDGTLDVLKNYKDRITNLTSEKDDGIYDAMNKGLARASGKYVIFMNGGDAFAFHWVLDKVAHAPQADLIYGDIFFTERNGERAEFPNILDKDYLLKKMVPHQATFYRRKLFERYGTFDTSYRIAGDYELFVRLLEEANVSHHHIAEPLAVFDRTGISSDRTFRMLRKRENHRVRKQYFPRYRWSLKALRQEIREFIQLARKN